jgi:hypothetical protein
MMCQKSRAGGFDQILASGLLLVAVLASAGCGTKGGGDSNTASWDHYIQAMDDALTRGDFYAADLARQTAYLLTLGSRRWEPMVAVGAAYLRFADSPGARPTLRLEARRIYRSALVRAGEQDSIEGVLRVSEALAALGDTQGAREGLAMAAAMAATSRGSYDVARAEALTERLDNEAGRGEESAGDIGGPAAAVMWTR